jgi:hypothetical protein
MKIDQDHLYYGAAVIQIAEDPSFTAINAFRHQGNAVECAYKVNQDIGVYLKYRTSRQREYERDGRTVYEYHFAFNTSVQNILNTMSRNSHGLFIGLVCVEDREICCLPYSTFQELHQRRQQANGGPEPSLTVLVSLFSSGGRFRVAVSPPRTRGRFLGDEILIARSDFPSKLFT